VNVSNEHIFFCSHLHPAAHTFYICDQHQTSITGKLQQSAGSVIIC